VAFVYTARELRLQRLRAREAARFGAEAVGPGGWRHHETEAFIEWASRYDDGDSVSRTLEKHQSWLTSLSCPVIRLDGANPLSELVIEVVAALERSE
jgi:hypothetical protein